MGYICQIQDGWMLYQQVSGNLIFQRTGYPYPDTEKSNAEMMKDLLEAELGISYDITWYQERLSNFVAYAIDSIQRDVYYIDEDTIYSAMSSNILHEFNSPKLGKAYVCQLSDINPNYITLYIHNPKSVSDIDNLVECLRTFHVKLYSVIKYNYSCLLFISKEMIGRFSTESTLFENYKRNYIISSSQVENMISERLFELMGIDYKCLSTILTCYENETELRRIFANPLILNEEDTGRFKASLTMFYSYDKLAKYFRSLFNAYSKFILKGEDLSDALNLVYKKEYSNGSRLVAKFFNNHNNIFIQMACYAIKSVSTKIDFSDIEPFIDNVLLSEIDNLYDILWNIAPRRYNPKLRAWIVGTPQGITVSHWDVLYNAFVALESDLYISSTSFKGYVTTEICNFKPTTVTSAEVIWDFTKYFDNQLSKVAIYLIKGFNQLAPILDATPLKYDKYFTELLECVYNTNDLTKDMVFNGKELNTIKSILLESIDYFQTTFGGFVMDLPKEITDIFGSINLYGKLLLLDDNYTLGCNINNSVEEFIGSDSDGNDVYVHRYVLAVYDGHNKETITHIKAENFKYISGALVFDFLRLIINRRNYFKQSYRYDIDYLEIDKVSIDFDESTQRVTLVYILEENTSKR